MVFLKISIYLMLCPMLLLCGITKRPSKKNNFDLIQYVQEIKTTTSKREYVPDYDYDDDCLTILDTPDDQLFGCLLKPSPDWELRVCKVEKGCEELVDSSIHFVDTIHEAKLNVAQHYKHSRMIGIRCPEEHNPVKKTCIGFIQIYIPADVGKRVLFNENVFKETEDAMISEIKNYQTTPEAKEKTIEDLQKIVAWMTPADDKCTMYKQICNLDGFFKETGGFVIHSPIIKYNMMLEDYCHNEKTDPTNKRVLAVLKKFIQELSPAKKTS